MRQAGRLNARSLSLRRWEQIGADRQVAADPLVALGAQLKGRELSDADYNDRWEELEAEVNPFALVVMAHLLTRTTRSDPQARYRCKLILVRRLYERGYQRRDILELFRFVDWMMALPQELEERLRNDLEQIETELRMPYITSIERLGIEKGRQEGLLEGRQEGLQQGLQKGLQDGRQEGWQEGEASIVRLLLGQRFGELPGWVEERLHGASPRQLESWAARVLDAQGLEAVFADA